MGYYVRIEPEGDNPREAFQGISAMFDGCFGLNRRPFASVPQVGCYFPAAAIEGARATLARCLQRGEGAGLLIGPSGTGKTLLCMLLAEQFRRSFQVAMLASLGVGTRRALFQAILYELGRPYRGLDEGESRLALVDYLAQGDQSACGVVLLVDEAHTLPLRVLEEIRLLTNLVRNGQPSVRLMLAGAPALEERFASPRLDCFSQRLIARCYLEALNRTETAAYIHSQINAAGGCGDALFSADTCQSVFHATGGIPRLVNQVCDHALLLAYVAGRQRIEPPHIDEAWGDLQQLPTPWNGDDKAQSAAGVIEFGSLDDQDAASSSSPPAATVAMPALRISPSDDDCSADGAEPVQQIHRIERLLAQADDFQPAGTIGPEIELQFDAPNPFLEAFQHEEIVADRYAVPPSASEPSGIGVRAEVVNEGPSHMSAPATIADNTAPQQDLPELVTAQASTCDASFDTDRLVQASDDDAATAEAWPPRTPQPVTPSAPPRQRAYRQLFAQLRRG